MKNLYFGISIAPYRIDLCNYLHNYCNFEIFHYCVAKQYQGQFEEMLQDCQFEYKQITPKYFGGESRAYLPGLNGLIKEYNPSVIFVPEFSFITLQVILIKKIYNYRYRIISQCDDSIYNLMGHDVSAMHTLSRKLLMSHIDDLVLDSRKSTEWYQKHYHKGVYFPIIADDDRYMAINLLSHPLAEKLMDDYHLRGNKVILYVGRLVEIKQIADLIAAYNCVKDNTKLVIVGDGEQNGALHELDSKLGTEVIFQNWQTGLNLHSWYSVADLFVLPSRLEPFGAVVNEALISGCRCIVSDRCGSATLIKNSVNGDVFQAMNIVDLKEKINANLKRIDCKSSIILRPNMMLETFNTCIKRMVKELNLNI